MCRDILKLKFREELSGLKSFREPFTGGFLKSLFFVSVGFMNFLECASQSNTHADHLENLQILIQ